MTLEIEQVAFEVQ